MYPYSTGSDGSLSDYSWVFDELQDEVDSKIDPDFVLPEEMCGKDGVFRKKSAKFSHNVHREEIQPLTAHQAALIAYKYIIHSSLVRN